MIRTIVVKELRDLVLSLRFQAGFVLALLLVTVSAFALAANYREQTREYLNRVRQEEDFLSRYAHLNRLFAGIRAEAPPSPLVLVRELPDPEAGEALQSNFMLELFPPADLPLIVGTVFSLFAIVLGFDAISGERERGTLKLMLASSVRRFEILAGKWLAGVLALAVSLAAALLAGSAIVLAASGAHWSSDDWISTGFLAVLSLAYCSAFYTMALAFSALVKRSAISVLACSFAWVLFVLVIPNTSAYIAAEVIRVPSAAAVSRDIAFITSEERDMIINRRMVEVRRKYPELISSNLLRGDTAPDTLKARLAADPVLRRIYERYRAEYQATVQQVNVEQQKKASARSAELQQKSLGQFQLAQRISCASPLPAYIYAAAESNVKGFESRRLFYQQVVPYIRALGSFAERRFAEEQKRNPAYGHNDFLDLSGRPRFEYHPPAAETRLSLALDYAGMLAGWNVLFLGAALAAFLRLDPR